MQQCSGDDNCECKSDTDGFCCGSDLIMQRSINEYHLYRNGFRDHVHLDFISNQRFGERKHEQQRHFDYRSFDDH